MEPHLELEALGILRQTKLPPEYRWLSDVEKQFLLDVLLCGEGGMGWRLAKKFERKHPEASLNLNVRSLTTWETDRQGKPSRLTLTWKGQELSELLLTVAKHSTRPNQYTRHG